MDMQMNKPVSKSIKRFWGVGEFGENFLTTVFSLYFVFFLTDICQLPLSYISFILLFTSIADFTIAPVGGLVIEGTKPMRWGRLRSWILVCPLGIISVFPLLFLNIESHWIKTVTVVLTFLLYKIISNIGMSANYTMIPTMVTGEKERTILASNRTTGMYTGSALNGYIAPFLLNTFLLVWFGKQWAYLSLGLCAAIVYAAGYWTHFNLSKGYDLKNTVNPVTKKQKLTIRQMLKVLSTTFPLIPVILVSTTNSFVYFFLPTLAVYYYNNVVEQPSLLSIHMFVAGICAVIGAYSARFIIRKISVRTACLIIYPVIAIALFSTRYVAATPALFILFSAFAQLFSAAAPALESNFYMDTIAYSEEKTGLKGSAVIMSMTHFVPKLSKLIKNTILSIMFVSIGYTAGNTSETVKKGIIDAYSILPAILLMAGWLLILCFYHLIAQKLKNIKKSRN
ncbi:hypothetical protein FACS1894182_00020 [Bacteroidia bacterium]|nr:hypothetical protein FACS1894182_00020 [Bacteroidia bacterium]